MLRERFVSLTISLALATRSASLADASTYSFAVARPVRLKLGRDVPLRAQTGVDLVDLGPRLVAHVATNCTAC